jgi:hypothetical protein
MTDKEIEDDIYDEALSFLQSSFLHGITASLRDGGYFQLLSPRLKKDLIKNVLQEYHQKFYYFFHDVDNKIKADDAFIRKILSNLDCQV